MKIFILWNYKLKSYWIMLIFARCQHSLAATTPVKYEHDIQWVITVLMKMKKCWFNGMEESGLVAPILDLGRGLLSPFPPFRYSLNISALSKHTLVIECHVYIWQMLSQLSCSVTCQIWKWFRQWSWYFCEIAIFANGEINEWSISDPHHDLQYSPWNTNSVLFFIVL